MDMGWAELAEFVTESHSALHRLQHTKRHHPADAHETYFQANGENYRIRIERIPDDSSTRRKGKSNANT